MVLEGRYRGEPVAVKLLWRRAGIKGAEANYEHHRQTFAQVSVGCDRVMLDNMVSRMRYREIH